MEAAGSRTLWSYSPGWRTLTQLGGQVPAGRSGDPALILDARARRLVLVLWGPSSTIPGETWTFDLLSQKWTDQQATPPRLPFEESNWPVLDFRREAAFDPVSQRTFVLMGGQLATYQTGSHQWDVVYPGPGWPSKVRPLETESGGLAGPLARAGHSLVYDPVNQRMLVYGGTWLTTEGKTHTGDVVGLRRAHQHLDRAGAARNSRAVVEEVAVARPVADRTPHALGRLGPRERRSS